LDEDRSRILSYGAAPDSSLVGIGERDLDSHRYEFFGEQSTSAAVNPRARNEMIARTKQREQRTCSRAHSTCKHQSRLGAFEHCDPPLNYFFIRCVAVSRVEQ